MTKTPEEDKRLERDEKILKMAKIISRAIGPLLFFVLLTSAIGQGGLDRLLTMTAKESFVFFGIIGMFFGIVWAYQNEIAGGIVIIVIYIAIAIIQGKFLPNPVMPIFLITGVLNIYVGVMTFLLQRKK